MFFTIYRCKFLYNDALNLFQYSFRNVQDVTYVVGHIYYDIKPETSREASYFIVMLCSVLEPAFRRLLDCFFFHICGNNRLNICNIPAAEFCFRGCRHHCVAVCAYVRACVPAQAERACVCGVNLRSTKICLAFWNLKFGATKGIN